MSLFCNAKFVTSVAKPSELPSPRGFEIAFAGRSNAGKSSAINALTRHTRLAFVSKTPGRTQLINFFTLADGAFLVDLPGYGYADVPLPVRRQWRGLIEAYLTRRRNLVGLVLIMDARRPLTELDRQLLDWYCGSGRPVHALLTKADKLSRSEALLTLRRTRAELEAYAAPITAQLFSALKKEGLDEAESAIGKWVGKNNAPG